MSVSEAASVTPVSTRRRTNSVAAAFDLSSKNAQPRSLQRPATEESNLAALGEVTKPPTRFRRSSFALAGERPTPLDSLVQEATEHVTQVAASRKTAKISTVGSPPSEGMDFSVDDCTTVEMGDSDDSARKLSVATLFAVPGMTEGSFSPNYSAPCSRKTSSNPGGFLYGTCPFIWHNTEAFAQNPLSSELVQKYLAMVAAEAAAPEPERNLSVSHGNLSGLMQLATSSITSMTMPVHQIRRALQSRSPTALPAVASSTRPGAACFSDRNAFTDTNYSSGLSDAEQWSSFSHQGYQSDNPMRDAASEFKQLRLAGQRLEADLHRSTSSLPRSRKTRSRRKSGALPTDALSPSATSAAHQPSKFDVIHVYEGLPIPGAASSTVGSSAANSLTSSPASRRHCFTPPCSPSAGSLLDSDNQNSLGSTNGLGRIRMFFDHWKPQGRMDTDDPNNYIYLDQQAQERRANARASNVIAPVSF